MPHVSFEYQGRQVWSSTGGCFGFAGRHSTPYNGNIDTFVYHIGQDSRIRNTRRLSEYLSWLVNESPWRHYFYQQDYTGDVNQDTVVKIKTDNPGHAVIGCASLARLPLHMNTLAKQWYELAQEGCDKLTAFLVLYSFGAAIATNTSSTYRPTGTCNLGDDLPLTTRNLKSPEVYSMLSGTFEFEAGSSDNYSQSKRYQQRIVSSYDSSGNGPSFCDFLDVRFCLNIFDRDQLVSRAYNSGGMGRSSRRNVTQAHQAVPERRGLNWYEIKGVVHTLSAELRQYKRYLGFGSVSEMQL